ncbi:hypothetical protein CLNEO_13720 [Anaerotignum neopropionicum]|uniref:Uncharacterized protein n=1 Tax=Anaerotignum neopropionicum TaxID=36847 RepID=A0A136WFU8_9FIRM|nr:hypothetical protein [Anaerotignum neopropionicum]KXL53401.1 hypothetical protein CLNEO_13720 [Anaerotignum neopropionicum]
MTQLEHLMETNATTNDLLDVIASYRYLVAEKEKEIHQLKEQLSQNTYTPPVIQDGVLFQMASVKYGAPVTHVKNTTGIKWYEDKLVKPELKII